ncbi:hypothetical protein [Campylobacter sp. RM16187]|uniref:hypothetical protein n=1 Tax=Campylobacter sp. RM16187 TaxID=1660063 RepID=UPI0021B69988|nr:hypothetical protein [Campylobacter sp. RM16187]
MATLTPEKLIQRARVSLKNPNEVTDDVCECAVNDALEACKDRNVPYFAAEDFAYIRLKIYLKIELDETDVMLYETAQKAIKNAPFLSSDGALVSAKFYKSQNRKSVI